MSLTTAQYLLLKAELQNDPLALGYQAKLTVGDQGGVAALMNAIGTSGEFQVNNEPVAPSKIVTQIAPADMQAMTSSQQGQLALLFVIPALDLTDANTFANVTACFPNAGTTLTNLTLLQKRQGTRGEKLFGNGVRIQANDISVALGS